MYDDILLEINKKVTVSVIIFIKLRLPSLAKEVNFSERFKLCRKHYDEGCKNCNFPLYES